MCVCRTANPIPTRYLYTCDHYTGGTGTNPRVTAIRCVTLEDNNNTQVIARKRKLCALNYEIQRKVNSIMLGTRD